MRRPAASHPCRPPECLQPPPRQQQLLNRGCRARRPCRRQRPGVGHWVGCARCHAGPRARGTQRVEQGSGQGGLWRTGLVGGLLPTVGRRPHVALRWQPGAGVRGVWRGRVREVSPHGLAPLAPNFTLQPPQWTTATHAPPPDCRHWNAECNEIPTSSPGTAPAHAGMPTASAGQRGQTSGAPQWSTPPPAPPQTWPPADERGWEGGQGVRRLVGWDCWMLEQETSSCAKQTSTRLPPCQLGHEAND